MKDRIERTCVERVLSRLAVVAVVLGSAAITGAFAPATAMAASEQFSAYRPVTPCRVADTRKSSTSYALIDPATIRIQLANRCGISADASAVAVSIAITSTRSDGFATITPAGTPGQTSTINWVAGETRAASTVIAVSPDCAVDVHLSGGLSAAAVIVDVTGQWSPVTDAVASGRLITISGRRVLDTRSSNGRLGAGGIVTIDRQTLGLNDSATAVAGTLTSTGGDGPGYLTAFEAGRAVPIASNVNTDAAGQSRAAGVIVPLGVGGLSIYAGAAATDVVFDVTGYVTGSSDPISLEGLLIAVAPTRILDTRTLSEAVTAIAYAWIPTVFGDLRVGGVIATITATEATAAGYASTRVAGGALAETGPSTSVLNWPAAHGAVASMIVQTLVPYGDLQIVASSSAAFIIDVSAYLLAAPKELSVGEIDDKTGVDNPTGDPHDLLTETYSSNELAAGGDVAIAYADAPFGAQVMVPYRAGEFPVCGPAPLCILVSPGYWKNPGADPVNSNRVIISHEWAHVLSMRFQQYAPADIADWSAHRADVDEECLADAVATIVLERGDFAGNETADYVAHYSCDEYWEVKFGHARVAEMNSTAVGIANELLTWAETWGSAHRP